MRWNNRRSSNDASHSVPLNTQPIAPNNNIYPDGFQALMQTPPAAAGRRVSLRLKPSWTNRILRRGERLPAPWMNAVLGHGGFGTVYSARVTQGTRDALRDIRDASRSVVRGRLPPLGAAVAIKIAVREDWQPLQTWVKDNVREAAIHSWLLDRPAARVSGCGLRLSARDHLPRLYFAGLLDASKGVFVTVMERVQGHAMFGKQVTLDKYLGLEIAAASLWASGVVHADLHGGNVMWDPRRKKAVIIDLGRAAMLPARHTATVRQELGRALREGVPTLGAIFTGRAAPVQQYVNRVQSGRHLHNYAANYATMERAFFNKLRPDEKRVVPELRKHVWGYGGL